MRRVVVTGMGVVSSMGITLDTFWSNLLDGRIKIHHGTKFDPHPYRSDLCSVIDYTNVLPLLAVNDEEAERLNDCGIVGLAAARQAVVAAKLEKNQDLDQAGFSMATTSGGEIDNYSKWFHYGHSRDPDLAEHCHIFSPAVHIAAQLNLKGPICTFSSACTSGTVSLAYAYETIKYSHVNIMLAGGSDVLEELPFAGFNSLRIVSNKDCRPFDTKRSGIIIGDGAAFLVLEEMESAINRQAPILAEIKGVGLSCDAYHATQPTPEGAARAMQAAIEEADIKTGDIQYINCHGTGTVVNDRAEAQAMSMVFGEKLSDVYATSTKSALGHLLGTAGSMEAVITTLAITKKQIPPMINLDQPDQEVHFRVVRGAPKNLSIQYAMSNSFGFGGNNISMVFGNLADKISKT